MPITPSGPIALIADIEAEFPQGNDNISLAQAGVDAGLDAANLGMTEFYGLSNAVAPTVVTNSATSVALSSMVLNGNVTADGGGTVTSRGFYFGTSSTYSSNAKYTVGSGTGSFSTTRSGLAQNTRYYITAFAINSAGESVGTTISQKTLFNYTFRNQAAGTEQLYPPTAGRMYYSNVNGGWLQKFTYANSQATCGGFCTNRTNYHNSYITSGSGTVIQYTYRNQCGHSGTISSIGTAGGYFYVSSYSNAARVAYAGYGSGGITFNYS